MAKRYELRKGDTCPCCGQKILTDDPEILRMLTDFAIGASVDSWLKVIGFEWPEADE